MASNLTYTSKRKNLQFRKGLQKRQGWDHKAYHDAKPVHVHCFTSSISTYTNVCTYTCMYILMPCNMVRTDDSRSERVNEEILLGRKLISIQVHQLMYA